MLKPLLYASLCLAALAAGCGADTYYPRPVAPLDGADETCLSEVVASVSVESHLDFDVEVHELLPEAGCPPLYRGLVGAGEIAEFDQATGEVWRAFDADAHQHVGTFFLADGVNLWVLE